MNIYQVLIILVINSLILLSGCVDSHNTSADTQIASANVSPGHMLMSVGSVVNGSSLPEIYSCNGPGQVPAVFWKNEPDRTESMVLILHDPDAPAGVYTHWIVYNLSPGAGGIPPNQLPVSERAGSGLQGINSMNTRGYVPPCPPAGQKHRYIFTLYALDSRIYPEILDRTHIEAAMEGHILDQARIVTLFNE